MSLDLPLPILYLITSGATTIETTPSSAEFSNILQLVEAAVASQIPLVQIREKSLSARVLYELTARAARITRGTATNLLVNDRSDIAHAATAEGVHLTTQSPPTGLMRKTYGPRFVIGVSTHSLEQASAARDAGADFAVFGPVFETESKRAYGKPLGLRKLVEVRRALEDFPVLAIGGITLDNVDACFRAGAQGVAAIRLLGDKERLPEVTEEIRKRFSYRAV
jgi:thiamine-phosphate pyrophosphorylase